MQQGRLFTWLSFGSAQPSKVAQFSVGANTMRLTDGRPGHYAVARRRAMGKSSTLNVGLHLRWLATLKMAPIVQHVAFQEYLHSIYH